MTLTLPQVISPIDIATHGLLYGNALTIATMGWIAFIDEEIIEVPELIGGGGAVRPGDKHYRRKLQKRITCTVYVGEKKYVQSVVTDNVNLNLKEVKLDIILEGTKPQIKIILPNEE
jgi:hypothetical protein